MTSRPANSDSSTLAAGSRTGRRRLSGRDYGILLFLAAIFFALFGTSPAFRTTQNLSNVLDQASINGLAACGATLTIVSGGFDLSMGSVFAVAAIVSVIIASTSGTVVGFVAAIMVGIVLGALNGAFITFAKINSFIATLATSFAYVGIATVITAGAIVTTSSSGFRVMNDVAGITGASWLFVAVAVVTGVLLAGTAYGRGLYAVGGNVEAARLSGLRIWAFRVTVFAISGVCAALAGFIAASRTGSADPSIGGNLALTAIAATVVGGTSIRGGEGTIWRAVIGVFILELISNGFNILGINAVYQNIVYGGLILVAVGLDQLLRRRR